MGIYLKWILNFALNVPNEIGNFLMLLLKFKKKKNVMGLRTRPFRTDFRRGGISVDVPLAKTPGVARVVEWQTFADTGASRVLRAVGGTTTFWDRETREGG